LCRKRLADGRLLGITACIGPARERRRQELPAHPASSAVSDSFLGGWEPSIPERLLWRRGNRGRCARALSAETRGQRAIEKEKPGPFPGFLRQELSRVCSRHEGY